MRLDTFSFQHTSIVCRGALPTTPPSPPICSEPAGCLGARGGRGRERGGWRGEGEGGRGGGGGGSYFSYQQMTNG